MQPDYYTITDLFLTGSIAVGATVVFLYVILRYFPERLTRIVFGGRLSREEISADVKSMTNEPASDSKVVVVQQFDLSDVKTRTNDQTEFNESARSMIRSKSDFIASMSHEFRTPLNAILGFTDMLKTEEGMSRKSLGFVDEISEAGNTLLKLVDDIMKVLSADEVQKVHEEKIRLSNFFGGISDSFYTISSKKDISVKLNREGNDGVILSDQKILTAIVGNIVDNAIKFTDQGQVTLQYKLSEISKDSSTLMIQVTDQGKGMDAETIQKAMEPFWQKNPGRYEGTGLGLTICRKMTDMLGGSINIANADTGGTVVTVNIPVHTVRESYGSINRQLKPTRTDFHQGLKILVVDDVLANRTLSRILLERNDFKYLEASNGKEALSMIEEERPDLVLLDINMPVMGGIEMVEILRSKESSISEIPVVAVTGDEGMASSGSLINCGFNALITKPFTERHLMDAIRKVMSTADDLIIKQLSNNNIITCKEVVEYIHALPYEKSSKMYHILKMQDMEAIASLQSVLDLPGDEPEAVIQKLEESGRNYDYLFITKVARTLGEFEQLTAVG